jgi:hypothetical protein
MHHKRLALVYFLAALAAIHGIAFGQSQANTGNIATGRPGIMTSELYHPVLDCFLRGLPHAYRRVEARPGTIVRVEVPGDCGGAWQIEKAESGWELVSPSDRCDARVVLPQEIAWRVFTRGISRAEAELQVRIVGDRDLGLHVLVSADGRTGRVGQTIAFCRLSTNFVLSDANAVICRRFPCRGVHLD